MEVLLSKNRSASVIKRKRFCFLYTTLISKNTLSSTGAFLLSSTLIPLFILQDNTKSIYLGDKGIREEEGGKYLCATKGAFRNKGLSIKEYLEFLLILIPFLCEPDAPQASRKPPKYPPHAKPES